MQPTKPACHAPHVFPLTATSHYAILDVLTLVVLPSVSSIHRARFKVESLARHIRRLAASIAQTGNGDNPPTAMRRPRAGSGLGAPRSRL